jgi:hypothetical protein
MDGGARVPGIPGEMGVLAGAGEIVTTGHDMRTFLEAASGLGPTPLAPALGLATTPLASGAGEREIGYAIDIEHRADGDVFRKGGNTSSYSAYVMWSVEPPVGVAVLTSCGGFMRVVELSESLYEAARAAL